MTPRPKVPGALFPLPPADEATLSTKQTVALRILRDTDGLTGYQLGQAVHAEIGNHRPDETSCEFCSRAGTALAKQLKRAGLVEQKQGGVFRAVSGSRGKAADRPAAYDPATSEWPAGFGDAA